MQSLFKNDGRLQIEFALTFLQCLGCPANAAVKLAEPFAALLIAVVQLLANGHHLGLNVGQFIALQQELFFPGAQVAFAFALVCAVCLVCLIPWNSALAEFAKPGWRNEPEMRTKISLAPTVSLAPSARNPEDGV